MANSVKVEGGAAATLRLRRVQSAVHASLPGATEASLEFLETKAKENLKRDVYNASKSDHLSGELYGSFVRKVLRVGLSIVSGQLLNVSGHALYLEFGTDNEGTGRHFVPVVRANALHWVDSETGQDFYSKGHTVKGVTPVRYMEKALKENLPEIRRIFRDHTMRAVRSV